MPKNIQPRLGVGSDALARGCRRFFRERRKGDCCAWQDVAVAPSEEPSNNR